MREPALFRRYPALAGAIPWIRLAELPTPLQPLELSGGGKFPGSEPVRVTVKRDDLTGRQYGGNKVRKLEFLLARARAEGARTVITAGAGGSHHALATVLYGRALGLRVVLVLSPQPENAHVREVRQAIEATGAELRHVERGEHLVPQLQAEARRLEREAVYIIPPGGSDAVGSLGYVSAALELTEQLAGAPDGSVPERVYLPAGTLGTAAGLAVGLELAGLQTRVVGVQVVGKGVTNRRVLENLLEDTARLLVAAGLPAGGRSDRSESAGGGPGTGEAGTGPAGDGGSGASEDEGAVAGGGALAARAAARVEIRSRFLGRGYGHPTGEGARASRVLERAGLGVDPTYTAKAAAALLADLARGSDPDRTLFWHTLSAVMPRRHVGG